MNHIDTALTAIQCLVAELLTGEKVDRFARAERICRLAHQLKLAASDAPRANDYGGDDMQDDNGGGIIVNGRNRNAVYMGDQGELQRNIVVMAQGFLEEYRAEMKAKAKREADLHELSERLNKTEELKVLLETRGKNNTSEIDKALDDQIEQLMKALWGEGEKQDALVLADVPRGHSARIEGGQDGSLGDQPLANGASGDEVAPEAGHPEVLPVV